MLVTLISNPPYQVDLQKIAGNDQKENTLHNRVDCVAKRVFDYFKIVCLASKESLWTNVRYCGTTFKTIVLGGRAPEDAYVLGTRLVIWVAVHTIGFIGFAVFLIVKNAKSLPHRLLGFVPPNLNTNHLITKKTTIDTSHVPDQIKVRTLLNVFDSINFTNPRAPGYMPPSTRREGEIVYSVAQLRAHLHTFVQRVETREAFLGTPPMYMAPQLMKFYKQIEDATRFSLHKVITDYETFMRAHKGQKLNEEHPDYQEYKNLLEDKARVAIDMAIAGAHCGARYMGDAMETYFDKSGNVLSEGKTMKDHIWDLLASKREKVARADIQRYLGHNTHAFSSYMANMGTLLGIPGTENIIEYLEGNHFDKELMLRHFFETYTADYIKRAVQEEIKRSQPFREAVFDWMKVQAKDWNKEQCEKLVSDLVAAAKKDEKVDEPFFAKINTFVKLVQGMKEQGKLNLEKLENWVEFIDELFSEDAAKEALKGLMDVPPTKMLLARMKLKQAMQKEDAELRQELQNVVRKIVQNEPFSLQALQKRAALFDKVAVMNSQLSKAGVPGLPEEVLLRCLEKKADLKSVIHDHVDGIRQVDFLGALLRADNSGEEHPAVTVQREGLKPQVLDWVLIASSTLQPN